MISKQGNIVIGTICLYSKPAKKHKRLFAHCGRPPFYRVHVVSHTRSLPRKSHTISTAKTHDLYAPVPVLVPAPVPVLHTTEFSAQGMCKQGNAGNEYAAGEAAINLKCAVGSSISTSTARRKPHFVSFRSLPRSIASAERIPGVAGALCVLRHHSA
jgi:hypothetical protein